MSQNCDYLLENNPNEYNTSLQQGNLTSGSSWHCLTWGDPSFFVVRVFQLFLKWFYALFIPTPGFTIQDLFPSNFERGLDTNLIWNYRDWILVITSYWIQVFLMLHCCTDVISAIFHALNACHECIQQKLNFSDETLHISCKIF